MKDAYSSNRIAELTNNLQRKVDARKIQEVRTALEGLDRATLILLAMRWDVQIGVCEEDTEDFKDTDVLRKWLLEWMQY
jgi:hypothetical protein